MWAMVHSWLWSWHLKVLLLVYTIHQGLGQTTEMEVRLTAPSWVARGGSATLRCIHQVPPLLLYKVEFLRAGSKILQYVRERVPPFTNYTFPGGKLNYCAEHWGWPLALNLHHGLGPRVWSMAETFPYGKRPVPLQWGRYSLLTTTAPKGYFEEIKKMSLATENSITIDNLDPSASGLYWCEVSLETPIFTAASPPHQLTIVYSQKHPPIITFSKPDVVVGGMLRANCTSAPAAPPPRLTWYIDNEKVPEEAVKYFSYRVSSLTRTKGGGGYRHRKHQHRYIAPEFNYTSKYWALVSETTRQPPANLSKQHKCTLKDAQSEEMAKIQERPRPAQVMPISLWVSIAELRAPAHGRLQLTCTATIPDEVGPGERYADIKKQTVTVAVNELSLKRPYSETSLANGTSPRLEHCHPLWLLSISFGLLQVNVG